MPVRDKADIEPALASFAEDPNGGLALLGDSFALINQLLVV
jgi:hypothetical protein